MFRQSEIQETIENMTQASKAIYQGKLRDKSLTYHLKQGEAMNPLELIHIQCLQRRDNAALSLVRSTHLASQINLVRSSQSEFQLVKARGEELSQQQCGRDGQIPSWS